MSRSQAVGGLLLPEWLLECRKRAEQARTTVVAARYLRGVSIRRMDKLVQTLGITGLSKPQVSVMAKDLDERVEQGCRHAPAAWPRLAGSPSWPPTPWCSKIHEGGRVVPVHALIAIGINADACREVVGIQVTSGEDGVGWLAFFHDLVARGLSGASTTLELWSFPRPTRHRRRRGHQFPRVVDTLSEKLPVTSDSTSWSEF